MQERYVAVVVLQALFVKMSESPVQITRDIATENVFSCFNENEINLFLLVLFKSQDQFIFYFLFLVIMKYFSCLGSTQIL